MYTQDFRSRAQYGATQDARNESWDRVQQGVSQHGEEAYFSEQLKYVDNGAWDAPDQHQRDQAANSRDYFYDNEGRFRYEFWASGEDNRTNNTYNLNKQNGYGVSGNHGANANFNWDNSASAFNQPSDYGEYYGTNSSLGHNYGTDQYDNYYDQYQTRTSSYTTQDWQQNGAYYNSWNNGQSESYFRSSNPDSPNYDSNYLHHDIGSYTHSEYDYFQFNSIQEDTYYAQRGSDKSWFQDDSLLYQAETYWDNDTAQNFLERSYDYGFSFSDVIGNNQGYDVWNYTSDNITGSTLLGDAYLSKDAPTVLQDYYNVSDSWSDFDVSDFGKNFTDSQTGDSYHFDAFGNRVIGETSYLAIDSASSIISDFGASADQTWVSRALSDLTPTNTDSWYNVDGIAQPLMTHSDSLTLKSNTSEATNSTSEYSIKDGQLFLGQSSSWNLSDIEELSNRNGSYDHFPVELKNAIDAYRTLINPTQPTVATQTRTVNLAANDLPKARLEGNNIVIGNTFIKVVDVEGIIENKLVVEGVLGEAVAFYQSQRNVQAGGASTSQSTPIQEQAQSSSTVIFPEDPRNPSNTGSSQNNNESEAVRPTQVTHSPNTQGSENAIIDGNHIVIGNTFIQISDVESIIANNLTVDGKLGQAVAFYQSQGARSDNKSAGANSEPSGANNGSASNTASVPVSNGSQTPMSGGTVIFPESPSFPFGNNGQAVPANPIDASNPSLGTQNVTPSNANNGIASNTASVPVSNGSQTPTSGGTVIFPESPSFSFENNVQAEPTQPQTVQPKKELFVPTIFSVSVLDRATYQNEPYNPIQHPSQVQTQSLFENRIGDGVYIPIENEQDAQEIESLIRRQDYTGLWQHPAFQQLTSGIQTSRVTSVRDQNNYNLPGNQLPGQQLSLANVIRDIRVTEEYVEHPRHSDDYVGGSMGGNDNYVNPFTLPPSPNLFGSSGALDFTPPTLPIGLPPIAPTTNFAPIAEEGHFNSHFNNNSSFFFG